MKVYSIGREYGCDIVINDNTDVISRRHATLNVSPSGKMTIVDLSHNGTYVNGIRINQNVPVPVTRKDNISFAHVARLDWKLIPDTRAIIIRYGMMALFAVVLIFGGIYIFKSSSGNSNLTEPEKPPVTAVDSTELKKQEKALKEQEKKRQDSIKNQVQDSLNNLHQNNKGGKTKKTSTKKTSVTPDKKTDTKKKEEPKQRRFH